MVGTGRVVATGPVTDLMECLVAEHLSGAAAKGQMVIAIFPLTVPPSRCRIAVGTWSSG